MNLTSPYAVATFEHAFAEHEDCPSDWQAGSAIPKRIGLGRSLVEAVASSSLFGLDSYNLPSYGLPDIAEIEELMHQEKLEGGSAYVVGHDDEASDLRCQIASLHAIKLAAGDQSSTQVNKRLRALRLQHLSSHKARAVRTFLLVEPNSTPARSSSEARFPTRRLVDFLARAKAYNNSRPTDAWIGNRARAVFSSFALSRRDSVAEKEVGITEGGALIDDVARELVFEFGIGFNDVDPRQFLAIFRENLGPFIREMDGSWSWWSMAKSGEEFVLRIRPRVATPQNRQQAEILQSLDD